MGNRKRDTNPSTLQSISIDLSTIEDLAEGDPAAMAELAGLFKRHTVEHIAKARAAIAARQPQEVARVAHTSIGFTSALGLISLVPILRKLERSARADQSESATFAGLVRLIKDWEVQFERVESALNQKIGMA